MTGELEKEAPSQTEPESGTETEAARSPQVALITGGARGIGRAIALALAPQGWSIAVCYRTSSRDATTLAQGIEGLGGQALAVRADVSVPEQAEALARHVETQWGRIDALINCAGPYHRVEIMSETADGWREMFANNLDPVFFLAQAVAPGMIERKWGRIISFSMATADQLTAQPGLTAHYIAKAGVLVLTRTLARVLAPHGITVNAISPGFIDSGSAPSTELETMGKRIPAGYVGSVEDAVNTVQFLLSEEASYVNGANIHLSGAWGI
ncbi:MAG TPA: SDR family oxidoreductase [Chloroflexota bacterium]